MTRNYLWLLGIVAISTTSLWAQQRWLTERDRTLTTNCSHMVVDLPNPASGPTTIALAPDGTVWFTESNGNRIGRMSPAGSGLKEFELPNPNSSPRIIALGSDRNM